MVPFFPSNKPGHFFRYIRLNWFICRNIPTFAGPFIPVYPAKRLSIPEYRSPCQTIYSGISGQNALYTGTFRPMPNHLFRYIQLNWLVYRNIPTFAGPFIPVYPAKLAYIPECHDLFCSIDFRRIGEVSLTRLSYCLISLFLSILPCSMRSSMSCRLPSCTSGYAFSDLLAFRLFALRCSVYLVFVLLTFQFDTCSTLPSSLYLLILTVYFFFLRSFFSVTEAFFLPTFLAG